MKTTQTTLRLTDPQHAWLKIEAGRLGVTSSEVVRRIVDAARERQKARARVERQPPEQVIGVDTKEQSEIKP